MTQVVIHCESRIAWQVRRAAFFAEGFRNAGVQYKITDSRSRLDGLPVLLGTTCWRSIECDGGDYLLVDRCSFGDTERFVSLVWNGHGRRGDHRLPGHITADRWERYGVPLKPWQSGKRTVLCGQTETYSPQWASLDSWYREVPATHFRKHPAGQNETGLPEVTDWTDCRVAVTLNSSVGVQCVLEGIPTITMDEGSMAWGVTGHRMKEIVTPERDHWCHWLAYTQWTDDEIKEGKLWVSRL